MAKVKSLGGVLSLPECKLNFYLRFDDSEPPSDEAERITKILDQVSNLSPELQETIVDFAEYLEKKKAKQAGQDPTT
jgi:hypothetical protein